MHKCFYKKVDIKKNLKNIFYILCGCMFFSVSVNCFTAPNSISPGGIVGIGQIISDFTGLSNGVLCIILNIPIFILGAVKFGYKSIVKNVLVALILYVSIDLMAPFLPIYIGEPIIASILAGVIGGIGLALIFITGSSTGGTGLLSVIINKYIPYVNVGSIILVLDGTIVILSALVYGLSDNGFEIAIGKILYAAILLYVQAKSMNGIIKFKSTVFGKSISVISRKNDKILSELQNNLSMNAAVLESKGAYTKEEGTALLGNIKSKDLDKAYKIIESIDEKAFIIVGDSAA